MDQKDLEFVPKVLVVTPGTVVDFPNSDSVLHNVFHPDSGDRAFDLGTYPRTEARSFTFAEPGIHVMLCHVHPEMVGFVIVVPSSWHGSSGDDGRFTIDGVPPGEYRLHVWHRRYADPDLLIVVGRDGARRLTIPLGPAERRAPLSHSGR